MSDLFLRISDGERFKQRNHTVYFETILHWSLTKFLFTTDTFKNIPQNVNPGRDFGKFWLRMDWRARISTGLTQTRGSPITPTSGEFGFLPELHGSGLFLIVTKYVAPCCSTWLLSGPSQLPFWPAHPAEEPRSRKLCLLSVRISEKKSTQNVNEVGASHTSHIKIQ